MPCRWCSEDEATEKCCFYIEWLAGFFMPCSEDEATEKCCFYIEWLAGVFMPCSEDEATEKCCFYIEWLAGVFMPCRWCSEEMVIKPMISPTPTLIKCISLSYNYNLDHCYIVRVI